MGVLMTETDSLREKATTAIGWVVVERWGSRLLSLGLLVLLTRALTPDEFGLVALAAAVTLVLRVFVDSGFSRALIQRARLDPADASTAFWSNLALAVPLTIGMIVGAPLVARLLGEPEVSPLLRALSLSLPLMALSQTPAALLERDFRFRTLSLRQLAGALCGAAVAVPLAFMGFGAWALVTQTLVAATASVITLWASTTWRPSLEFSRESFRNLRAVGTAILGIDLLDAVHANVDKLVVGAYFGPYELGYYYLAQRIGIVLIELVTSVISRVSFTTFSRVQDDVERLNRVFRQLTFAASALSVPVFSLVAVLATQLVPMVFGPGWSGSVPLMWILAPGWVVGAVMYFDRSILLATRRARTALGLSLFQNVVGIVLVFLFLPLGVAGVAYSRLARIITWPIRLFILHRAVALQVWPYLLQTLRCVAAIAPVVLVIGVLQTTSWAHSENAFWTFAVPLGALGLAVYAGLAWALAGNDNRHVLKSIAGEVAVRVKRRQVSYRSDKGMA